VVAVENPIHRAYLLKIVGEEGLKIVEAMPEGEEVTDEHIAEITGISLNTVRRSLYLLYEHRLAVYRRKRDPDSGWLTYLWKICPEALDSALEAEVRKLINKLNARLRYEKDHVFYACVNGCARFVFEEATENNFICPFCQGSLEYMENSTIVEVIEERIKELSAALCS